MTKVCQIKAHLDIPQYACPKCKSVKVIIYGGISAYANYDTVNSIEFIDCFKCENCEFTEEWIKEDGNPIFSKLEKEWSLPCPCGVLLRDNRAKFSAPKDLVLDRINVLKEWRKRAKGHPKKQQRIGIRLHEAAIIHGLLRGKKIFGMDVEISDELLDEKGEINDI